MSDCMSLMVQADLIQQIEHGVDYVLACYRNFGHYTRGVICPDFEQYLQMGDAASQTDGLVYDPSLAQDEVRMDVRGKKTTAWPSPITGFRMNMKLRRLWLLLHVHLKTMILRARRNA